jgi:hypothetical protein
MKIYGMTDIFTRDVRGLPPKDYIVFEGEGNNISIVIYLMQTVQCFDIKLDAEALVVADGVSSIVKRSARISSQEIMLLPTRTGATMFAPTLEEQVQQLIGIKLSLLMDDLWVRIVRSLPPYMVPKFARET